MDPDKENKYDIKTTVNALHDSGIDIMESPAAPQDNDAPPSAAPKAVPAAQMSASPSQMQNRPSAQTIIDGVLGIGSVKAQDLSKNDPSVKPLRTFKTDAEEAVKYNNVSKISIAVAEQNRRDAAPAASTAEATPIEYDNGGKSTKIFIFILVLGLLLGIGAGAYYWFFMMPSGSAPAAAKAPKGIVVKTIIPYDQIGALALGPGQDALSLIGDKLASTNVPIGEVFGLLLLPAGTTTIMSDPASIFSGTHIPDRLSRSISGDYMVGTYFSNSNDPFIILKNTFFQNAFAGMLDWEKDMRNDLISLIRVSYKDAVMVDTNSDIFSDLVVSNIDARVLRDASGKTILAYAFADKDTLVITTNVDALKYVLDKLLSVRVVQ